MEDRKAGPFYLYVGSCFVASLPTYLTCPELVGTIICPVALATRVTANN